MSLAVKRITPPSLLLAVTAMLLVIGVGLIAVGRHSEPAIHVEVRDVWLAPERYEGRHVVADGTLRIFLPGTPREHYAIEDEQQFRIGVRDIAMDRLDQLVDSEVEVEGVLRVNGDIGIFIEAEHVSVIEGFAVR